VTRTYTWDGSQAALAGVAYDLQPQPELLSYCEPLIGQAGNFWDSSARLEILRKLLPVWPPASDPQGRPYSKADQDKLRFELAVNLALNGEPIASAAPASLLHLRLTWRRMVAAAAAFQRSLEQDGLYMVCQAAPGCDLHGLRQTLALSAAEPAQALAALQAAGTAVRSSAALIWFRRGRNLLTIQPRPG
jgi:hypothetical protein